MNRSIAVIDIDGVLADVSHRLHYLQARPKNWAGFFARMGDDPLFPQGLALAQQLADAHDIVYMSGRPERTRDVTQTWLTTHGVPRGRVLLRPDDDRRPARQFKLGVLNRLAQREQVSVLVDDDPLVCQAARDAGFTVREVLWGQPDSTLFQAQESDGRT